MYSLFASISAKFAQFGYMERKRSLVNENFRRNKAKGYSGLKLVILSVASIRKMGA